ncbi:MAG: NUDIX hydrolase [Candidatus Zixiibacteriota bacterium]
MTDTSENSPRHGRSTAQGHGFDLEAPARIKNDFSGYRYCPRCANEMTRRTVDDRVRLVCPDSVCGFIYYHNPVPGAGVVVFGADGLLLVKRAHHPRIGWWCLPAGYMEWDESPEKTAIRESREETGLDVELSGLFNVYSGADDPRANTVLTLYSARVIGGALSAGDDASEAGFYPLTEVPRKIAFATHRQAIEDLKEKLATGDYPS